MLAQDISRQATREQRLLTADFVIDNSLDLESLIPQIDKVWEWLVSLPQLSDDYEPITPTPNAGPQTPPSTLMSDLVSVEENIPFRVVSEYSPAGDQPKAIAELSSGIDSGLRFQTLLGITGSGKSATIAWTIEKTQRPTLILAPNKSLAAQLAQEMMEFFPDNRVEYFVSYYDYYQPEAYIASSDTFIEKDSSVNDDIDRLRHSATCRFADTTRHDCCCIGVVYLRYG